MSAERKPHYAPGNVEDFVDLLEKREIQRKRDKLGDEAIFLALEDAAIRAKDEDAERAARDFRLHIGKGGRPDTFIDEHPQHEEVDFTPLMDDVEFALGFLPGAVAVLTDESRLLGESTQEDERSTAVSDHTESTKPADGGEYEEKEVGIDDLRQMYPKIDLIFSTADAWDVDSNGRKSLPLTTIKELVVYKNPEKEANPDTVTVLFSMTIRKKWEAEKQKELGKRIKGRGMSKFLEEPDAEEFLLFLHENLGEAGFGRPYKLDDSDIGLAEFKKKLT